MAAQDLNLLKAARIAEAKQRVDESNQERDAAQREVNTAKVRLQAADATNIAQFQRNVQNAERDLNSAESIAAYERANLNKLLDEQEDIRSAKMVVVQYAVFGILALVVLIFLMYGIVRKGLLDELADMATSRGLITFLIAVVTVTIALVLTLATVVAESPDREKRFSQGKEVLTALIGVLGTIVGFYFGHALDASGGPPQLAPVYISNDSPKEGDPVNLVTFVSAGRPPYTYDVTFSASEIPSIEKHRSQTGLISEEIQTPCVTKDTDVYFVISIKDEDGKSTTYRSNDFGKALHLKAGKK